MRTIKKITIFVLILSFSIIFVLTKPIQAQFTQKQKIRMTESANYLTEKARNLPSNEKKIAWFMLKHINRMTAENAKFSADISAKYSVKGMPVDNMGRVLAKIALRKGAAKSDTVLIANKIRELDGTIRLISAPQFDYPIEIYCWLPYDKVKEVAKEKFIANISSIGSAGLRTGDVTTAGDSQLKADQARSFFGVNGSGVTVGVISNGIENSYYSQLSGDLPGSLTVRGPDTSGDEGTAMMEIVYDIAPGVNLVFGGIDFSIHGPNDMANRITDLYQNAGCKIVVDDIGWFEEPYFSESYLMNTIRNQIQSYNKVYIAAAGNEAEAIWNGLSFVDQDNWVISLLNPLAGRQPRRRM